MDYIHIYYNKHNNSLVMIPMQTTNVINISLFSSANVNTGNAALPRKSPPNSGDVIATSQTCSHSVKLFIILNNGNKADIDVRYTPSVAVKIRESPSRSLNSYT